MNLLDPPKSPLQESKRLGAALRSARRQLGYNKSDELGKSIGVSGRSLRELEASGKGSVDTLIRTLLSLSPDTLELLINQLECIEPTFSSVEEALNYRRPKP